MPKKAVLPSGGATLAVYLTKEQIGYLRRAAAAEQTTVSEIARRCVRRYFYLPDALSNPQQLQEAS